MSPTLSRAGLIRYGILKARLDLDRDRLTYDQYFWVEKQSRDVSYRTINNRRVREAASRELSSFIRRGGKWVPPKEYPAGLDMDDPRAVVLAVLFLASVKRIVTVEQVHEIMTTDECWESVE